MRDHRHLQSPRHRTGWISILLFVALASVTACKRNPAALKLKYMENGNRYFSKNRYEEAAIEYRNAIQIDPRSAEAYYRLGLAEFGQGQWSTAAVALNRAIELAPDNLDARLRLGDMLISANQFSDAKTQADEVLKRDPQNASAHILLGQVHLQQRKYPDAKSEFEQAVKLAPQDPVPYDNLALAQLLGQEFDAAEKNFQKAVELKPDDAQSVINLANYYRSRKDPARAEQALRNGMAHNPKAIQIPLAIADLYAFQGRAAETKSLLDQLESNEKDFPDSRREVADFYFAHNDPASALDRYLPLAQKDRKDLALAERIGESYVQLGHWSDAERWINQQDKNNKDPEFELLRARTYLGEFRFHEAITELQSLINQDPLQAAPHYYLAQVYAQQGDDHDAQASLTEAARVQPGYLPALLGLADISLKQNDSAVALAYANQIITHSYWMVDAHLIAGNAYLLRRDISAAQKEFEIAVALNPRNAAAQERLARVLDAQAKYKDAEKAYESALADDPVFAMALSGLAEDLDHQGRQQDAIARINKQIELQPKAYQLQLVKGDSCVNRKDWSCGEQSYREALVLNPYAANAYLNLARIYEQTNRTSEVLQEYEQARQKFPDFLPTYILLGMVYEHQGDYDRAKQCYQDALRIDSNFFPAQNNLAWLYVEHGGPLNEALELAQRAKAQHPDDPHVNDTLAWIYYKEGLYPSALQLLETTVARNPQSPEYQFHLGMTYLAQGKPEQGRKSLQSALRMGLSPDDARAARDALQKIGS